MTRTTRRLSWRTSRVLLLIGKDYAIRSQLLVAVVGQPDAEIEVWAKDNLTHVCWPMRLEFVDIGASEATAYATRQPRTPGTSGKKPRIEPSRAGGGSFRWPDNFCCYQFAPDGTPLFICDGTCGCGGCATADGSVGDVKAVATFTEEESGEKLSSGATVVRLAFEQRQSKRQLPLDVSFFGVMAMEVPTTDNVPVGYFSNPLFEPIWNHTKERAAGVWHRPGMDNFFFADEPSFGEYCPPPLNSGVIDWKIPVAWGERCF